MVFPYGFLSRCPILPCLPIFYCWYHCFLKNLHILKSFLKVCGSSKSRQCILFLLFSKCKAIQISSSLNEKRENWKFQSWFFRDQGDCCPSVRILFGKGDTIHNCTNTRDINWDAGLLYLNLTPCPVNNGPMVLFRSIAGRLETQLRTQNLVSMIYQCSVGYICCNMRLLLVPPSPKCLPSRGCSALSKSLLFILSMYHLSK